MSFLFKKRNFWILKVKNLVKSTIKRCMKCIRFNAKNKNQLMSSLPSARVEVDLPFSSCGVDLAGPCKLKMNNTHTRDVLKGYIVLLECGNIATFFFFLFLHNLFFLSLSLCTFDILYFNLKCFVFSIINKMFFLDWYFLTYNRLWAQPS